jgi:anti-sigma regulatory factor (Ser/Thr protein kinase)
MIDSGSMIELGVEIRSASREWTELCFPSTLEAAKCVQEYFGALDFHLPEAARCAVTAALHELMANAVEWGGKLDPKVYVRVIRLQGAKMVMYCITDPGKGFHAADLPHAAISYDDDHKLDHVEVRIGRGLRPGGFGLLMVRELVDELIYNQSGNEVVFVKYF